MLERNVNDQWIRERAASDRQKDEAADRAASENAQRERNRMNVINEQLPGVWMELSSVLQRKVGVYNEARGKAVLSVNFTTSGADGARRQILLQRDEERQWAYVIECDFATGTLTSRQTTSGRTGGHSDDAGNLLMTVAGDAVVFAFKGSGQADIDHVADELVQAVLRG
jgi:hypothetical protein